MEEICSTCLSRNRRLVPLKIFKDILNSMNWLNIDFNIDKDWLCWECKAVIMKISRFRRRAILAQELLLLNNQMDMSIMQLSTLTVFTANYCVETHDNDENKQEIENQLSIHDNSPEIKQTDKNINMDSDIKITIDKIDDNTDSLNDHNNDTIDNFDEQIDNNNDLNTDYDTDNINHDSYFGEKIRRETKENAKKKPKLAVKKKSVRCDSSRLTKNDMKLTAFKICEEDMEKIREIHGESSSKKQKKPKLINEMESVRKSVRISRVTKDEMKLTVYKMSEKEMEKMREIQGEESSSKGESSSKKQKKPKLTNEKKSVRISRVTKNEMKFTVYKMSEEEMDKMREFERSSKRFTKFPYKCETCIVSFLYDHQYRKHMKKNHSNERGTLICRICRSHYKRPDSLKIHEDSHYQRYQCRLCDYYHKNLRTMLLHYSKLHDTNNEYVCKECNMVFNIETRLKQHLATNHRERPTCDYCGKDCSTKSILRRHFATKHNVGNPLVKCGDCNKWFKRTALRSHRYIHRQPNENVSYAEFKDGHSYRRHLLEHSKHRPDKDKYICPHCNMRYLTKTYLTAHILAKHLNQFAFPCHKCDKKFVINTLLKQHISRCHEGNKRLLPKNKLCPYCGKVFRYGAVLVNHMRTHTGERPYECDICHSKFKQKITLQKHIIRHIMEEKVGVSCRHCNLKFSNETALYSHISAKHSDRYRFPCNKCHKIFKTNLQLKRHVLKYHEGVLPPKDIICPYCDKGFTRRNVLLRHIRTHTGERYECEICTAKYVDKYSLQDHIKARHQKQSILKKIDSKRKEKPLKNDKEQNDKELKRRRKRKEDSS